MSVIPLLTNTASIRTTRAFAGNDNSIVNGQINVRNLNFVILFLWVSLVRPAVSQETIGFDDFDGNGIYMSRTFDPDLSFNGGTFPTSIFDVFGIVDRNVNINFSDNTLVDPACIGLLPSTKTDKFLGISDICNSFSGNDAIAELQYRFDIENAENLALSIDVAAFADFESATMLGGSQCQEFIQIDAFIAGDANGTQTLFQMTGQVDLVHTYTFEGGSTFTLDDPLYVIGDGTIIDNQQSTLVAPINGCLLYTSPSPRDLSTSRMPSSA